jgi:hypothetical protein
MSPTVAATVAATLAVVAGMCALAYGVGLALSKRGEPLREWVETRVRTRGRERPAHRPIEAIAADLRRLGGRFQALPEHASFAKVEAVRGAYDRTLGECCAALGITHLLGVLPAGPELDAERTRVEEQLADSGLRFPHAA